MKFQISTSTHLLTGSNQKVRGHNQPLPGPDRVKLKNILVTYHILQYASCKISYYRYC